MLILTSPSHFPASALDGHLKTSLENLNLGGRDEEDRRRLLIARAGTGDVRSNPWQDQEILAQPRDLPLRVPLLLVEGFVTHPVADPQVCRDTRQAIASL
jgi:hypothetical protein